MFLTRRRTRRLSRCAAKPPVSFIAGCHENRLRNHCCNRSYTKPHSPCCREGDWRTFASCMKILAFLATLRDCLLGNGIVHNLLKIQRHGTAWRKIRGERAQREKPLLSHADFSAGSSGPFRTSSCIPQSTKATCLAPSEESSNSTLAITAGLPDSAFPSRARWRGLSEFCERYDGERDGLWLALQDGKIEGAIAIDGSHAEREGAHLRWFIASDSMRGKGVGKALLDSAMEFCQSRHYERIYLWTFEGLGAARHLYEKSGFRLTRQQRGTQWGVEVDEQRFERAPALRI